MHEVGSKADSSSYTPRNQIQPLSIKKPEHSIKSVGQVRREDYGDKDVWKVLRQK